jgi:hypothetical protein
MNQICLIICFLLSIVEIAKAQKQELSDSIAIETERNTFQKIDCNLKRNKKIIRNLQKALKMRGYKLTVDGIFGDKTQACLCDYIQTKGSPFHHLSLNRNELWQSMGIDSCFLKKCKE